MTPEARYAFKLLMERLNLFRCSLCVEPFQDYQDATIEHVKPRSHFDAEEGHSARNITLAHQACNKAKGARPPRPCELIYLDAVNTAIDASEAGIDAETAFEQGWQAREDGRRLKSNPYFSVVGVAKKNWSTGWVMSARHGTPRLNPLMNRMASGEDHFRPRVPHQIRTRTHYAPGVISLRPIRAALIGSGHIPELLAYSVKRMLDCYF